MSDVGKDITALIESTPERIKLPETMPQSEADVRLLAQAIKCLAAVWTVQEFSMTYDPGRPGLPTDVSASAKRDGLGHLYTFEPEEFSCSSPFSDGGWEEERILGDMAVEGVNPYDTEGVVGAIRQHHSNALAALGRTPLQTKIASLAQRIDTAMAGSREFIDAGGILFDVVKQLELLAGGAVGASTVARDRSW